MLSLQRAVLEWGKYPRDQRQRDSIAREVRALGKERWYELLVDPNLLSKELEKEIASLFRKHREKLMREWREKTPCGAHRKLMSLSSCIILYLPEMSSLKKRILSMYTRMGLSKLQ